MIEYFIEVPNTNIKEPVLKHEWASELCYQIAQDFKATKEALLKEVKH